MSEPEKVVHNISAGTAGSGKGSRVTDHRIMDAIYQAILEHRLAPGTKLGEEALCEVFGVSRTRIRRALLSLANRHVVELQPNRGAFVAKPSEREARHVFEARRAIEQTIVRRAAERVSDAQLQALMQSVEQEAEAQASGNLREATRLSGGFHLRLAKVSGNQVLEDFLANLISRTSLIINLYGSPNTHHCSLDEHREIVELLRRGDATRAAVLMDRHLQHVEATLRLAGEPERPLDLQAIFADYL